MVYILILTLLLSPCINLHADTLVKARGEHGEKAGDRCYTEKEQVVLDEALNLGIECQTELKRSNLSLSACRKWRDKYKSLLDDMSNDSTSPAEYVEYRDVHKWTKSTWFKFGVATVLAVGLGIGIGATI